MAREGNICGTVFFVVVLLAIGGKMVEGREALRRWGLRLGGLAFLGFLVAGVAGPRATDDPHVMALGGLFVAGVVLGVSWIVLPVIAFLFCCFVTAPITHVRGCLHRIAEMFRGRRERRRAARASKRWAAEDAARRRQAEEQAPARAAAQKRREDARAACEMLYSLHVPDIEKRFSRDLFNDFMARHLGDQHPPEYVEERSRQLSTIIQKHADKLDPPPKELDAAAVVAEWKREEEKLRAAKLDPESEEMLLCLLHEKYVTRIQKRLGDE